MTAKAYPQTEGTLDEFVEFDADLNSQLGDIAPTGAIQLPFEAPIVWWSNGNERYDRIGGPAYYGGWSADAGDLEAAAKDQGLPIPSYFERGEIRTANNELIAIYQTRRVLVAPIDQRTGWLNGTIHSQKFEVGARRHTQILCYLADVEQDGTLAPWGPVVLSAKGFVAQTMSQCFEDWKKRTQTQREKTANGWRSGFFYHEIGTFGNGRPNIIMVGKVKKSPITPMTIWLPAEEELGAYLRKHFVGTDTSAVLADRRLQAFAWLQAWKDEPQVEQPW